MSSIDKRAFAITKELATLMVERFSMNPVSSKLLNEAWQKEFPDEVAIAARMLALLDELEAKDKRIAELEAREVKLPELKMLSDYLAEVTMREREDILVGVRLEFHRALKEGGIKVAAAAKGE